ncbi:MAG: hypothetical protein AAB701_02425 [Patescibacteria group bacterium]
MELIITQEVFAWIFGVVGVLLAIILLLIIIALAYIVFLLKLIKDKSGDVSKTVDLVQHSVRETIHSFDDARAHVAQFVGAVMNASTIANVVRSVRTAWHGDEPRPKQSHSYDDLFDDIHGSPMKRPPKQRRS